MTAHADKPSRSMASPRFRAAGWLIPLAIGMAAFLLLVHLFTDGVTIGWLAGLAVLGAAYRGGRRYLEPGR